MDLLLFLHFCYYYNKATDITFIFNYIMATIMFVQANSKMDKIPRSTHGLSDWFCKVENRAK